MGLATVLQMNQPAIELIVARVVRRDKGGCSEPELIGED